MTKIMLTTHDDNTNVAWDDLTDAGRAYLAQYGMSKSLQDAASGTQSLAISAWLNVVNGKTLKAELVKPAAALVKKARDDYGLLATSYADAATYANAVVKAQKDERLAAILSGDVSVGTSGPRLKGLDAVMRDVAIEMLRNAYGAKGMKFPADAGTLKTLIAGLLAKRGEDIRNEAQRRMDVAIVGDDADDILSGLGVV